MATQKLNAKDLKVGSIIEFLCWNDDCSDKVWKESKVVRVNEKNVWVDDMSGYVSRSQINNPNPKNYNGIRIKTL